MSGLLHGVGSAQALGLGRIAVYGIWLVSIAATPVDLYASLPGELFHPPGALHVVPNTLFHLLFHPWVLGAFKAGLLVLLGLVVLGVRPFGPLAVAAATLILVYDGVMKGFNGHINHAQLVPMYAAFVLAAFPAADGLSVMGRPRHPRRPELYAGGMLTVALILCFTYSLIGVHRVISGGLEIFTGDAIVTHLAVRSLAQSEYGFEYGLLPLGYSLLVPLLKIGYVLTTAAEIASPVVLVSNRLRRAWVLLIVPFHGLTLLTMNIFFWENVVLILVFLTGLGYVARRDRTISHSRQIPRGAKRRETSRRPLRTTVPC